MTFRLSSKLYVIGCVVALLITAFIAPSKSAQPSLKVPNELGVKTLARETFSTPAPLTDALKTPLDVSVTPQATVDTSIAAPAPAPVPQIAADGSLLLRSTAYNSLEAQTDSTPFITSTGEQTRFGIIAVSRDLLDEAALPYGSLVRLTDMGNYHNGRNPGQYQALLDSQGLFIVEDTMHERKYEQIDVWFPEKREALQWGVRQIKVEVVRRGREEGGEILAVGGD